jgi:hypothetical protein
VEFWIAMWFWNSAVRYKPNLSSDRKDFDLLLYTMSFSCIEFNKGILLKPTIDWVMLSLDVSSSLPQQYDDHQRTLCLAVSVHKPVQKSCQFFNSLKRERITCRGRAETKLQMEKLMCHRSRNLETGR